MNLSNTNKFSFTNNLEICRLCLSFTKTCFSLIESSEASGMLEALTSIRILPSDAISTIMCLKCSLNLKLAFIIQQNILRAEHRFRERIFSAPLKQECDVQNVEPDEKYLNAELDETKGTEDNQQKHNISEYRCKVCDKKCSSKIALGKHMLGVHVDAECPICGMKYRKKCLKRHMKDIHNAVLNPSKQECDVQKPNEYSCDVCDKKYSSKDTLGKHMLAVHVEADCPICGKKYKKKCLRRHIDNIHNAQSEQVDLEKYNCDICGAVKTSKGRLDEHKKRVHIMRPCPICNEKFAKFQLEKHVREHGVSNAEVAELVKNILQDYFCEICGKKFLSKAALNRHKDGVHLKEECPICGKKVSKGHIKEHVDRHGVSTTQAEKETNPDEKEPKVNTEGKYVCDICGKKKFSEVDLRKHKYNVHVTAQCSICKKIICQTNIKRHIERHKGSRTICELCGISVLQHDLRVHMYNKHTVRKLKCHFCDKIFNKNHQRTFHEKKHHLGQADFTCETCGKSFFKKHFLKKHIESTHLKLRPHICEFCNVGFSSRVTLITHRRQHTNERPYKCEFCGEGFRQNVSLKSHLKSQHDVTEELKCKCEKCGKKFASSVALHSHSRIH